MNSPLHILRRRIVLIMGITFLGFLMSALILKNIDPVYSAKSQIIFNEKNDRFIKTQKEIIISPDLIRSVIIDLRRINKPSTSITKIQKNISVSHLKNSYIMDIKYSNKSPKNAAIILNKIVENYIADLQTNRFKNENPQNIKTLHELQININNAQYELDKHQQKIMLQEKYNILKNPSDKYKHVRAQYEKSVDNLHQFLNVKGNIYPNPIASEVLNSPIVKNLKLENINISKQIKSLSNRYPESHYKIMRLKSKQSLINSHINREIKSITERVKLDYKNTKSLLKEIEINEYNNKLPNNIEVTYNQLQNLQDRLHEAQTKYNSFNNIYNNLQNENGNIARTLTKATLPTTPSFPNYTKILGISTLISLIAGIIISLLIEKLRNTFLSAQQLEKRLNLPCFALIPRADNVKGKPLSKYVMENPSSPTSEAVRALRLVLKLHADAKKLNSKVITITSSFPGEGKTTLSSWVAQIAAKSGKKVILIDADLRRPSIHKCFGKKNALSLVEYLVGNNKLNEIIDTNNPFNLHIIYGRSVPNSALDLISSDKMDQLLRHLRKTYDLIIIDSPACMAVPDATALEQYSDQLLYAVHWNKTTPKIVHNGISQFLRFGKPPIATVLTNIDLKKHIEFGYGNSINYYERYKEYSTA